MHRSSNVGNVFVAVIVASALGSSCTRPNAGPAAGFGGGFDASTGVSSGFTVGAITGTTGVVTTGGIGDSCAKYAADLQAKSITCGVASNPGPAPVCMDATEAALDACLDGCLPLMDCACTKEPSAPGCSMALAPYASCTATCEVTHGATSSVGVTTGSVTVSASVSVGVSSGSTGTGFSTTSASASSGAGGSCGNAMPGSHDDPQCDACWGCASDTVCSAERMAFVQAPFAGEWLQCAQSCPPDDPATPMNEFQTCVATCGASYPGAEPKYLAFLGCAACNTCATSCNSAGYFGNCSQVAPF